MQLTVSVDFKVFNDMVPPARRTGAAFPAASRKLEGTSYQGERWASGKRRGTRVSELRSEFTDHGANTRPSFRSDGKLKHAPQSRRTVRPGSRRLKRRRQPGMAAPQRSDAA